MSPLDPPLPDTKILPSSSSEENPWASSYPPGGSMSTPTFETRRPAAPISSTSSSAIHASASVRRKEVPPSSPTHREQSNEDDLPPSYSTGPVLPPTPSYTSPPSLLPLNPLPNIPYHQYIPPGATMSKDQTTITLTSSTLSSDPVALVKFLREQAQLPPKPVVKIRGNRRTDGGERKMDFDLALNLLPLVVRDEGGVGWFAPGKKRSGGWEYVKTKDAIGLEDWCRQFCVDGSELKTFTLTRSTPNLDTAYIEGAIRTMIASTGYTGTVTISFPSTHSTCVVSSPSPSRKWWEKIIGPKVPVKNFSVVESVWPVASNPPAHGGPGTRGTRECATQSEAEWWAIWSQAARAAVVGRKRGYVTVEDWMDVAMMGPLAGDGKGKGKEREKESVSW